MNDDDGGGSADGRRSVRHHGKHHKMAPPNRWPTTGGSAAAASVADVVRPAASVAGRHHRRHDVLVAAAGGNDTASRSPQPPPPHVLQHAAPDSMCYTTNEVLVIIAVTCFLNFAFILLIMTCVHCFTDPSHHKKFGSVAYAELGDELFDADMIDGDTVTLLNPTKSSRDALDYAYEKKNGFGECDLESCAPYRGLIRDHRCKSRRKSEDDLLNAAFE
ncbi:uncharacterized protein LOC100570020 [Acyrthosiphon pisum]|uniref:Uncharacterized protein n=1 Tax=Acyrthosiphon pisum TaxID=7029 RepID=A0A8R2JSR9_ACYPI|nr:uncharacterized protein LOC100570020 [Acyrthosiphon pisum]XP_016663970.1 uncharacterized protein LOC100570020 [Acyrthosiphon pisum]XP_029346363.1 uncharacterized protein LOC100570020 [Acyrthosiphon pisum]XP_029346364.1 uncharacterized protein LOC100570020 [Acyrthosiphon pisum]XP_029346365.1 uncharacterized protein LOC100570020 [Acyrthosiphon pisum]XP_029346366.1 uncharacterized protein LOC100570020 [Acyrthosiphon pisum]XP_029346367.1 uncharacterized protein LOC100570020 [Acyrthosiphon pisu|eukprot:XP_003247936.1 PREDICTED: uncharacterized protein LOC100570020 [Acyrthosiphon pisum]